MHVIVRLAAGALLVAACNSQQPQGSGGPGPGLDPPAEPGSAAVAAPPPVAPEPARPQSTLEQVQRWAPKVHTVAPAGVSVPGIDIFMVSPPAGVVSADGVRSYAIVGVSGGPGGKLLEREELVRAAGAAVQDAPTLARLAMLVYRKEGDLLATAATDAQRKAGVAAPAIVDGAVEFWVWTTGASRVLMRGSLELATGVLDYGPPVPGQEEAVAKALAALAGTSAAAHGPALKALGGACASHRKARRALLDALAHHARAETRAAAAAGAGACGAAAFEPLLQAMESDASVPVRAKAATALGALGDGRARPALERAAKSDSPALQQAAKQALGKLK
ncbi:MAG TPA: HEAT repeat domain-containing protein [Kofleriaceae bacterium]|nr:HEAT repeat domain-containing protein [Kofleriaceae bacterium]